MSLIPQWAPNLHPLLIHFPIVLVITAVTMDLALVLFRRPLWLGTAAAGLYGAGFAAAIATYVTGLRAGSTVFVPGMAHPLIDAHRDWALVTTGYLGGLALVRLLAAATRIGGTRSRRVLLLAAGFVGVALLQQTAERGARLVYEYGVGVIARPTSP